MLPPPPVCHRRVLHFPRGRAHAAARLQSPSPKSTPPPTVIILPSCLPASACIPTRPSDHAAQDQRNSPYYATLYSYRENPEKQTSTVCIQIRTLDVCLPGKWRCCNTSIVSWSRTRGEQYAWE